MSKGILACLVERVPVGQLKLPEGNKLSGVVTNFNLAVMVVCIGMYSVSTAEHRKGGGASSHV